jgi:hypothetical protein
MIPKIKKKVVYLPCKWGTSGCLEIPFKGMVIRTTGYFFTENELKKLLTENKINNA